MHDDIPGKRRCRPTPAVAPILACRGTQGFGEIASPRPAKVAVNRSPTMPA